MKKLITFTLAIMLSFVSSSFAEMKFGVSAALTKIEANGSEKEGTETNTGSADNTVVIPSLFVEYAFSDTLAIGVDYIPMSADVSDKTKKRTDVETSVTGTATQTTTSRAQSAQAELKNHVTLYANYGLSDSTYFKAGVAMVSLETDESLATGSTYGNEDIFGGVVGFGAEQNGVRVELLYTDYEEVNLTSSATRAGVTNKTKIDADLDTLAIKLSYAF